MNHRTAGKTDWLEARLALMTQEKELTRLRDRVAQMRRELPWVKLEKSYQFDTEQGPASLTDLFRGRRQLLVYHFMFGPDWQEGCPSCSFWADNFNANLPHLAARDTQMAAVSRAPLETLLAYRRRMGWQFDWASSATCDFNFDFEVSFPEEELPPAEPNYNFGTQSFNGQEAPGLSVFILEGKDVYHSYSCYARGLDAMNSAYQHLDLTPLGRQEEDLPHPMDWVRRHDSY